MGESDRGLPQLHQFLIWFFQPSKVEAPNCVNKIGLIKRSCLPLQVSVKSLHLAVERLKTMIFTYPPFSDTNQRALLWQEPLPLACAWLSPSLSSLPVGISLMAPMHLSDALESVGNAFLWCLHVTNISHRGRQRAKLCESPEPSRGHLPLKALLEQASPSVPTRASLGLCHGKWNCTASPEGSAMESSFLPGTQVRHDLKNQKYPWSLPSCAFGRAS